MNKINLVPLFLIIIINVNFGLGQKEIKNLDANQDNIVFELPDIISLYQEEGEHIQLEAFKSIHNDKVLETTNISEHSKLIWVSTGDPRLMKTPMLRNKNVSKLFHFTPEGFYTYIQMLTYEQQVLLVQAVKRKYKVDISVDQIVNLIVSQFQCTLTLYSDLGQQHVFIGTVSNFRKFPLRMDFRTSIFSKDRAVFMKRISEFNADDDEEYSNLNFKCELASSGHTIRTNTLKISANQIHELDIIEKIFGPANSTYVTREQLNELAAELYTNLNIVEDYRIPTEQFSIEFVNGLITQTATKYTNVDFDTVLKTLSTYRRDFIKDLSPDVIKSELSKVFKLEKIDNHTHIKTDENQIEQLKTKDSSSVDVSAGASFKGFGVKTSVQTAKSKEREWMNNKALLNEQIRDLNSNNQDNIEWSFDGEKIVPKNLNVAQMNRASFSQSLTFNRIKRVYEDAPFKRKFSMYTTHYNDALAKPKSQIGSIFTIGHQIAMDFFYENGKGFGQYLGWYLCDGRNGAPDLRGRSLFGLDPRNSDYSQIGKTGGLSHVKLTVNEIPSHTHVDPGHSHSIYLHTSASGNHSHEYTDLGYPETFIDILERIYSNVYRYEDGKLRFVKYRKMTSYNGVHQHSVSGSSETSNVKLSPTGNGNEHENRPPFYVVAYIIYLGV